MKDALKADRIWLLLQRQETRHLRLYSRLLERQNNISTKSVIAHGGPVLSLTTYGGRLSKVYLTIESIAAAPVLPCRLILWLDDKSAFANLPDTLRRLEFRGLEVRLTSNLGPHTKYYPSLEVMENFDTPLVVCDDDMLYPRNWLSMLMQAYRKEPALVNCHRAHVVRFAEGLLAPYATWQSCRSSQPSFLHFATGVSGIIFPRKLMETLNAAGKSFQNSCPKADDIWLHVNALRAGIRTKQISEWQRNFPILPGSQETTLSAENVHNLQNDVQIAKTYMPADLALLTDEANGQAGSSPP